MDFQNFMIETWWVTNESYQSNLGVIDKKITD
jgi:hypothetical protein